MVNYGVTFFMVKYCIASQVAIVFWGLQNLIMPCWPLDMWKINYVSVEEKWL